MYISVLLYDIMFNTTRPLLSATTTNPDEHNSTDQFYRSIANFLCTIILSVEYIRLYNLGVVRGGCCYTGSRAPLIIKLLFTVNGLFLSSFWLGKAPVEFFFFSLILILRQGVCVLSNSRCGV